ncbi:MAG: tyrosine protein phosphatase [Verrucomicrobiales bacterium]|nr:tyrosine protein phosphatase [Verrucomicrobiales bacterium]
MSSTSLVANFRDVGESVNRIADREVMKVGVLYRGGDLRLIDRVDQIHTPQTIINLQSDADIEYPGAMVCHFPAPSSMEIYEVEKPATQAWIAKILGLLASESIELPVMIHCAAGKDRTGVLIAALLGCMGVDYEIVRKEYELSAGNLQGLRFDDTLAALADHSYFKNVECEAIAKRFLVG